MLPSAAELEYFLEVAHSLNLSRASERLGISQPSLSLAIKRLEKTIGTDLLIRHKQGVTLTQAGKQLLLQARQLLQTWETTKASALASQQEIQGHFTLGCNAVIAIYVLSAILPDLLEKHPKLNIQLKHELSRKITEKIINLSIDLGIVINPIQHPDLIIKKLGTDETTFWRSSSNRTIQDPRSKEVVVICNPDSSQAESLLQKSKKMGFHFERLVTTDSMEVVADLTAKGCGLGILPARVAQALHPKKLYPLPQLPTYSDELCLVYRDENRKVQALQAIAKAIKDFFKIKT